MAKNLITIMRRHWNNLLKDEQCIDLFTQDPFMAYTSNKNIKDYPASSGNNLKEL